MQQLQHYVLFPNHDNGMRLYKELKALGVRAVISPTPRTASKCCGISLMVEEEDLDTIQSCAKDRGSGAGLESEKGPVLLDMAVS